MKQIIIFELERKPSRFKIKKQKTAYKQIIILHSWKQNTKY